MQKTNNFPGRLKELRLQKKLSQPELGKILGLAKQTISSYEKGNSFPSQDIFIKIANYFHVNETYLLGRTEDPRSIEEINSDLDEDWPEVAVILRKCGKKPNEAQRRLIAKIVAAAIDEIDASKN